jgi:hypothetical protein
MQQALLGIRQGLGRREQTHGFCAVSCGTFKGFPRGTRQLYRFSDMLVGQPKIPENVNTRSG